MSNALPETVSGNDTILDLLDDIIKTGDVEGSVDNPIGVDTDVNLPGALTNIAGTSDTLALLHF